ncbi:MAG TPA: CRTAC1 family protein [Pyrinomonadaceae bacterium]|nr:CRTAC1 family protein [Pyrinomonadaceae bacterium]
MNRSEVQASLSCRMFIGIEKHQIINVRFFVFALYLIFWAFLAFPAFGQVGSRRAVRNNEVANDFPVTFTDIAGAAGLSSPTIYGGIDRKRFIIETNGCGVAFFDYDNDGWLDVLILSGTRLEALPSGAKPTNRLYRNNRNGTFTEITDKAGLRRSGWASSVCIGDYDNDGYDDLFITYWGQNVLYRNNGNGTFTDLTEKAGLSTTLTRWGSGCTFVDYDRDGKLDLFVANYLKFDIANTPEPGKGANCTWKGVAVNCGPKGLPTDTNLLYRNNGDGTFTDVSELSGIAKVQGRYSMTATTTDFNNDGWTDIYVACDSTASTLYRNNRDGTFTDVAVEAGCAYNEDGQAQAGMGVATGDYNGDGLIDIFKTHFSDDLPALYKNTGRNFFDDASRAAGFDHTPYVEWGTGLADFDNDGWPDILIATGNVYPEVEKIFKEYPHRSPRLLYQNLRNGRFREVTPQMGAGILSPKSSRGCAFGDFDNDGDIDVLVMNMNEPPLLLRNEYISTGRRETNNWLELKLVGTKSNRTAIGARLLLKTGSRVQIQEVTSQSSYYSHNDLRLHFGLGQNEKADVIEIRWPTGQTETLKNIVANQILAIKEKPDSRK